MGLRIRETEVPGARGVPGPEFMTIQVEESRTSHSGTLSWVLEGQLPGEDGVASAYWNKKALSSHDTGKHEPYLTDWRGVQQQQSELIHLSVPVLGKNLVCWWFE